MGLLTKINLLLFISVAAFLATSIMANIYKDDSKISKLAKKLTK